MTRYNGSTCWLGNSSFWCWADYEVTSYNDDNMTVRYRRGVTVGAGSNWYNSVLQYDSWCSGEYLGYSTSSDTVIYSTGWTSYTQSYGSGDSWSFDAGYYAGGGGTPRTSSYDNTVYFDTPTYTPYAPSSLTHTRVNDNKNTLSWTNNAHIARPYTNIVIQRKTNNGSWTTLATINGSSTSYNDTTTTADNSYSYRICAKNSAGSSSYTSATTTTYNTPAAPASITLSRSTGTVVDITLVNASYTATGLELQRSTDGTTYTTVSTLSGLITSTTDNPGGGLFYYRARNTRSSLKSDWTTCTSPIQTIAPPAAPTLISPAMSTTLPAGERVRFEWRHNPVDGSVQTAYELQYRKNSSTTWSSFGIQYTDAQYYETTTAFAQRGDVEWQVHTKGVADGWGPYSSTNTLYIRTKPTASITAPAAGSTITALPITVTAAYNDTDGTLVETTVSITESGSSTVLFSKSIGAALTTTIAANEFTPVNGKSYTITVLCRSSSSLTASATSTVSVSYTPPKTPAPEIQFDVATGYVNMTLNVDSTSSGAAATSMSVAAIIDGQQLELISNAPIGSGYVDKVAPINKQFTYIFTAFAASGSVKTIEVTYTAISPYFYCYWGNNYSNVAKARWTPTEEISYKRPAKTRVYYAGRKYPLSYDTIHREEVRTFTAELIELSEAEAFRSMVEEGGRCIYKNGYGDIIPADVEISLTPTHKKYMYGKLNCQFIRIDSGAL